MSINHWTVGLLFHSSQQKDNDGAIERRSTVDRVSFRITGHYRLANPQFVTPCYGAGFVLRNGDKLREIIQDSLAGPQRHSFAAVLAFGYARFFVAQMFLTDDPGPNGPNHYNIFLLHPFYPDGSAMELAQFAAACLGEVEKRDDSEHDSGRDRKKWGSETPIVPKT